MEEWSDWWLFKLTQNLLGYASIGVPGGLLVCYLRKTKYLDSRSDKCVWRCLRFLAVGNENASSDTDVEPASQIQPRLSNAFHKTLVLLFCVFGLLTSYLIWGVLQEKIMTKDYEDNVGKKEKFSNSQFLVFVNRVLAFIFAGIYIALFKQPSHRAPFYKYSYCSFSNIMSSWCQYESLKYVSFPTQVLAKASKIIPVMLMGKLVSKKTYRTHEYGTAVLISCGMTLFLLSRSNLPSESATHATTVSGLLILLAYMVSDSFTANWQGELFKQYHMSSAQMMCGVNLFSCLFTSVSLLQQGGFSNSFVFLITYRTFLTDCILLSICSAIGQLFIFYTISKFGPVVFVIVMTVRQLLAILLSCLIYKHSLTAYGVFGVFIVFTAIFLRVYLNHKVKLMEKSQPLLPNDPKV